MAPARKKHPLEITLVLDTLTSYIPLDDLGAYRLVCKSWFLSSLEKWRANKFLVIKPGTSYPDESDIKSLEYYSSLPYTKLVLDGKSTSLKHLIARSCSFWKPLLSNITHLTLKDIGIYFYVDKVLHLILCNIPNATDLVLERNTWMEGGSLQSAEWDNRKPRAYTSKLKRFAIIGNDEKRSSKMQMFIPWRDFFYHFPDLESLEVTHVCGCAQVCWTYFEQLVHGMFDDKRPGNSQVGLHIKSLKLGIFKGSDTNRPQLKVDGSSFCVGDAVDLFCRIEMTKLTTLQLDLGIIFNEGQRNRLVEKFPFIQIGNL